MFEHKLVISPLKFAITSNTFFLTHLIVSEHSFVKLGCKNFYLSISTPIGSDKSRLYHHWRFCFSKANFIFHSNMVSTVLLNLVSKDFHFVQLVPQPYPEFILTSTACSVTSVSTITGTCECPRYVCTGCVRVTVITSTCTFINICKS